MYTVFLDIVLFSHLVLAGPCAHIYVHECVLGTCILHTYTHAYTRTHKGGDDQVKFCM